MIGLSGTLLLFCFSNRIVSPSAALPPWVEDFAKSAFGIYILQQFVLKALYYHTSLPMSVDYALVPWVGFGVALTASWGVVHFSLKTKTGRFLLG